MPRSHQGRRSHEERRSQVWKISGLRRVLRRPVVWWAIVAVAALVTGWSVNREYSRAVDAQLAWGSPVRVVVATGDIDVGDPISGRTELQAWPSALVPPEALLAVGESDVARVRLISGELVLAERVSSGPAGGLVDLLPEGTVALAVPVDTSTPPVSIGDHVDLHATFDRAGESVRVAKEAVVVDLGSDAITVAIDDDEVPATASALAVANVTIALTGR